MNIEARRVEKKRASTGSGTGKIPPARDDGVVGGSIRGEGVDTVTAYSKLS